MATHAALDAVLSGYASSSDVYHYNYGSPRVGNVDFAELVENNVNTIFRVVHHADPVPHIPNCRQKFFKCDPYEGEDPDGKIIWPAWHIGPQIFYNKDSSDYEVCTAEQNDCANGIASITYAVSEHSNYFGITNDC